MSGASLSKTKTPVQLSEFESSAYVGLEGKLSKAPGSMGDLRQKGLGLRVPMWGSVNSSTTYTPTRSGCMNNDNFFKFWDPWFQQLAYFN